MGRKQAFNGLYQMQGIDPNGDNVSTARDLASLTYHFLKNYPEILEITNKPVVKTMVGTPYEETFEAYNYSLPGAKYGYQGVDGLKQALVQQAVLTILRLSNKEISV